MLNKKYITLISIILTILLLLCLLNMPYGYFQLVRLVAALGFALLAYFEYQNKRITVTIGFSFLVLLFQPFVKVALGRSLWNIVDVVVAVLLILYMLDVFKKKS